MYKDRGDYKMIALQNHGNDSLDLNMLEKAFREGLNGCTIEKPVCWDDPACNKMFHLHIRVEFNKLTVTYGDKPR